MGMDNTNLKLRTLLPLLEDLVAEVEVADVVATGVVALSIQVTGKARRRIPSLTLMPSATSAEAKGTSHLPVPQRSRHTSLTMPLLPQPLTQRVHHPTRTIRQMLELHPVHLLLMRPKLRVLTLLKFGRMDFMARSLTARS